ncbi:MAG: ABC transporter permease, partial [Pseudomonadota bacterium]
MTEALATSDRTTDAPETTNRSLWGDVWVQYRSHTGAMIGTVIFVTICLLVVFGPLVHTVDPTFNDLRSRNAGISWAHP